MIMNFLIVLSALGLALALALALGLALSLSAAWHALPSAGSIYGCVSCSCRRFIKMCSNTKTERRPEDSCLWHPRCGTTVSGSSSQLLTLLSPHFFRVRIKCAPIYLYTSLAAPTNRQK